MNRIRIFIVLFLALGLGGTFAMATYRYITNRPVEKVAPTTPVVVAGADLALGAELRKEDLRTIAWPADAVPAGSFTDPKDLVGRGLIQSMVQNEAVCPPSSRRSVREQVCRRSFRKESGPCRSESTTSSALRDMCCPAPTSTCLPPSVRRTRTPT